MPLRNLIELARAGHEMELAHHFQIFMCPACPNAHIVLFDEDDIPIAQMTVGSGQLEVITEGCKEVFNITKNRVRLRP